MDLGTKPPEPPTGVAQSSPEQPETIYPSFSLADEPAETFMAEHADMKVGDECTVTMRLRLTTLKDSETKYDSGKRVEFDCLSMDNVKAGAKSEAEEPREPKSAMGQMLAEQEE